MPTVSIILYRQKYRDLYNEVVDRGELPSDLPPDWLDVHNHLWARYTMRPSSLPENFSRKDGQVVKMDGQMEKKKKKKKKKGKSGKHQGFVSLLSKMGCLGKNIIWEHTQRRNM